MPRLCWPTILERARAIAAGYDTPVTLRQLFYRLVSEGVIPNTRSAYTTLAERTARARDDGEFPPLLDQGRAIRQPPWFCDPAAARTTARDTECRDRTKGQPWQVWLVVEKTALVPQLDAWFGQLGVPIVAGGGCSSQTLARQVRRRVESDPRPAAVLIAGDLDPSGEDIARSFLARSPCWDAVEHLGLTREQAQRWNLPPLPGKTTDRLFQIELDAVDPHHLRGLYADAIARYWDPDASTAVLDRQAGKRQQSTETVPDPG